MRYMHVKEAICKNGHILIAFLLPKFEQLLIKVKNETFADFLGYL